MDENIYIQTHELCKNYKHPTFSWLTRAKALRELTISVNKGEVFGLLGPNGSGKSTTIKLILGLIFPTSGHISVLGSLPGDVKAKKRIGFLPEESYLYRFLNAQETLDFYGRIFHIPRRERMSRIDALLDLTGLSKERKRPLGEFSKGMQRRIGIAQALINDPDLVILDEPTTGLDPLGTTQVKDLIMELKEKGKTVFLSSHLLADVEDVCDRISILYGGQLRAMGTVDDLLSSGQQVQVTANLSEDTTREIEELIKKREGADTEIKVAPPAERLEKFFLRVVNEAQQDKLETSGVEKSTGELQFISNAKEPASLLDSLTQEQEVEQKVTPQVTVKNDNAETLLSKLADEKQEQLSTIIEETKPVENDNAGNSLLNKLTKEDD